jgi:T5SS/PEP-CTERM-associated repeat protein
MQRGFSGLLIPLAGFFSSRVISSFRAVNFGSGRGNRRIKSLRKAPVNSLHVLAAMLALSIFAAGPAQAQSLPVFIDGGATGTVTVSGSGSWTSTDLTVGQMGTGTLNIQGGTVISTFGVIGWETGIAPKAAHDILGSNLPREPRKFCLELCKIS